MLLTLWAFIFALSKKFVLPWFLLITSYFFVYKENHWLCKLFYNIAKNMLCYGLATWLRKLCFYSLTVYISKIRQHYISFCKCNYYFKRPVLWQQQIFVIPVINTNVLAGGDEDTCWSFTFTISNDP